MKKLRWPVLALALLLSLAGCATTTSAPSNENTQSQEEPLPSESTEPEVPSESADEGTYTNPYPAGTTITNGAIEVTLGSVEVGVDRIVTQANSFNDPAPDGQVYVRVPATVKNIGEEKVSPFYVVTLVIVAASGESYEYASVSSGSGSDPQTLIDLSDLYSGGQGMGYIYFTIPKSKLNGAKYALTLDYGNEVFINVA